MTQKNLFSTKANNLIFLKNRLKKSKIEKIYTFSYLMWTNEKEKIINNVSNYFKEKIVVRSSAINEDSNENSMAGYYESILNVNSQNKGEVQDAITRVIKSYNSKKSLSAFNQILIQSQTKNVEISGVIFTRGLEDNSPYYTINFDDKGLTDSVTSGTENKSIKVFKYSSPKKGEWYYNLIESVKELEDIYKLAIDIEFAINKKGEVIIFQVRPICIKRNEIDNKKIILAIKNLKSKFYKIDSQKENLEGKNTIFTDMSDWNPAEILGDNPGYLDYSLYDYIITNSIWHQARTSQGYYNIKKGALVYLFGNKPYIDVRKSFNSFVPASIPDKIRKKLLSYYLNKLRNNPELQDKVEFEILFTCHDFCIDNRLAQLKENDFSNNEIKKIKESLIDLTNDLIINSEKTIKRDINSCKSLEKIRKKIRINSENGIIFESLKYAKILLEECKEKGTLQFSRLARLGFIAKIILKSLSQKEIISEKEIEDFFSSISTVATDFTHDFNKYMDQKISKNDLLKKYGHLRPGTYDITSNRYDHNPQLLDKVGFNIHAKEIKKKFNLKKKTKERINLELIKNGFKFSAVELFEFATKATQARELSKFEFTKNLSDAIELIAIAGTETGFSREEMSYLSVKEIFIETKNRIELAKRWKEIILKRIKKRKINNLIHLPSIIFSKNDFYIVKEYLSKPNYITQKKISSRIVDLSNPLEKGPNFKGKIVLIENADPGYDWIFTKNIGGLITKYGGVASHMSIRCAEFMIPAAIGCGSLYDKIKNSEELILDCKLKKIITLKTK
jgi:glutamine kinase